MKLPEEEIKKIAVFRALQLGDMLCVIPALRALRKAYPRSVITLVGLPWASALTQRFPDYFDSLMVFPGYPGLPEQPLHARQFPEFLKKIQFEEFDLVLQLQGSGTISNPLVKLFNGKHTAGFYLKGNYCPDPQLYLYYPTGVHEIKRHLMLMEHLGIDAGNTDMEFPLYDKDYEDLAKSGLNLKPREYVCVHPGSRSEKRQWPPKYFAALADYCAQQGLKIVLTGTKDELELVNRVAAHMNHKPEIAAGKTSIGAAGVLIKNAFALISNCTGVSHIAAAVKTPSVVISMDGEKERWAPLNHSLHRSIDWTAKPVFDTVLNELKMLFSENHSWAMSRSR